MGIELGGTAIGIYPVQAGNKIAVNVNVKTAVQCDYQA